MRKELEFYDIIVKTKINIWKEMKKNETSWWDIVKVFNFVNLVNATVNYVRFRKFNNTLFSLEAQTRRI